MPKELNIAVGDWISWYDYQEGRFYYGEVRIIKSKDDYPKATHAYTDNGRVDFKQIVEIRKQ